MVRRWNFLLGWPMFYAYVSFRLCVYIYVYIYCIYNISTYTVYCIYIYLTFSHQLELRNKWLHVGTGCVNFNWAVHPWAFRMTILENPKWQAKDRKQFGVLRNQQSYFEMLYISYNWHTSTLQSGDRPLLSAHSSGKKAVMTMEKTSSANQLR